MADLISRFLYLVSSMIFLSQGTHSNCIFKFPLFSLFFPCPTANFPCAIYVIFDYYIHKADFADFSSLNFFGEIFAANFEISFTFRIREFWQNFQILCVFPDREYFWPFFLFSLCSGYPAKSACTLTLGFITTEPLHPSPIQINILRSPSVLSTRGLSKVVDTPQLLNHALYICLLTYFDFIKDVYTYYLISHRGLPFI